MPNRNSCISQEPSAEKEPVILIEYMCSNAPEIQLYINGNVILSRHIEEMLNLQLKK
jgi:hypothetical protein